MGDWKCRRCGKDFAKEDKLERHLAQLHGATNNRDPRLLRIAAGAAAVVAVGLIVALVVANQPAETRAGNVAAFELADDPYLGDPDADVVVVAMEAPMCSACRGFHQALLPELQAQFFDTGRAVLYYSQFTAGYEFDLGGGVAQECVFREAGSEGFWPFTEAIYAGQAAFSPATAERFLKEFMAQHGEALGVDEEALLACYRDDETAAKVSADWRVARSHEAQGTPTFFVFGQKGEPQRVSANDLHDALSRLA